VHADGSFVVEGLGEGPWRFLVATRDGSWEDFVRVALTSLLPDQVFVERTDVRIDVPIAERRLGRVRGHVDPGFAGSAVRLVPSAGTEQRVPDQLLASKVAHDGALRFDLVLPSRWDVEVKVSAGPPLRATVDVAAGQEAVCAFPSRTPPR
jgi:hypothetical protein